MVWRQRRIGGAFHKSNLVSRWVGDIPAIVVSLADSSHIADVVTEGRYDEVQPVARGYAAHADVPATQDFLAHEGDHNCMIHVVVGRVAGCDILECQLGDKAYDTWKSWL